MKIVIEIGPDEHGSRSIWATCELDGQMFDAWSVASEEDAKQEIFEALHKISERHN